MINKQIFEVETKSHRGNTSYLSIHQLGEEIYMKCPQGFSVIIEAKDLIKAVKLIEIFTKEEE